MADRGDVTTTQAEVEWKGILWEVDMETGEGGSFLRLSLWRTKANGSREHVQAEDPPQDPLTLENVQEWLIASDVPESLVHALAARIIQARSSK